MEHTYNPLFRGRAKLFRAENSGYTLVQSIDFDSAYSFVGVTEGEYIIQASQDTGYYEKLPFVPTYYGASLNWENATVISYGQGSSKTLDIMLMPMSADNSWNMGDYNIYGNINILQNSSPNMRTTAVSKQTIVYLKNESGQILTYTVAEDNFYYFYQLVSGNYTLDFEYPGMNADPASIVLQGDPNIYTEVNTTLLPSTILGGIQKQNLNTVAIYPNPISDKLILNFNSTRNNLKISLIKMDGTVMMEEKIAGPITSLQLNLYDQKQGFYLLKIEDAISSETYKVMKQ